MDKQDDAKSRFKRIRKLLGDELCSAWCHYRCWKAICDHTKECSWLNQNQFMFFSAWAHLYTVMLSLAHVIDKHKDSVNIYCLREAARSVPTEARPIDSESLERLCKNFSATLKKHGDAVKSLRGWRSKSLAHLDRNHINKGDFVPKDFPLAPRQLRLLMEDLREDINRLSEAFGEPPIEASVCDVDRDIEYLFTCLRGGIERGQ